MTVMFEVQLLGVSIVMCPVASASVVLWSIVDAVMNALTAPST